MEIAGYRVRCLLDGTFGLDGGSMFGVVPRALWERHNPPDERNRIALASRLLLLEGRGRKVLVDTGLGDRWDDKEADIYAIDRGDGGVSARLRELGVEPAEITDVLLTHLHFDHAGGTTRMDDGDLRLSFPEATHHLQRRHWEWAHSPTLKDAASFRDADFSPLRGSERLRLVEGEAELWPGVRVVPLEGHTTAMQAVKVEDERETLFFCADLVPTRTHLRLPYVMAYDNRPLTTLDEKRALLTEASAEGWILVLEHDPEVDAIRIVERAGRFEVADEITLVA